MTGRQSPERIQLRRSKGWRKPVDAVVVARPSRWGNPCRWVPQPTLDLETMTRSPADPTEARRLSVIGFVAMLTDPDARAINNYPSDEEIRRELASRDLACWCPLPDPCHADVLLAIANGTVDTAEGNTDDLWPAVERDRRG